MAGVVLCLLAWMPLPLGLASTYMAAGWTQLCTNQGVTTVLLEDLGGGGKEQGKRHCILCWGQAPEHDAGHPPAAPALFEVAAVDGDVFPAREPSVPPVLLRVRHRSRAPPASA